MAAAPVFPSARGLPVFEIALDRFLGPGKTRELPGKQRAVKFFIDAILRLMHVLTHGAQHGEKVEPFIILANKFQHADFIRGEISHPFPFRESPGKIFIPVVVVYEKTLVVEVYLFVSILNIVKDRHNASLLFLEIILVLFIVYTKTAHDVRRIRNKTTGIPLPPVMKRTIAL
jgi:hypothetical protein